MLLPYYCLQEMNLILNKLRPRIMSNKRRFRTTRSEYGMSSILRTGIPDMK